jgi:anti-sigma regulatory factor (Ser/Thr protein kinase)
MSQGNGELSFELTNDLAEMPLLAEHLEQFCHGHGIDPDILSQVNLALDEIVIHIISYGYGGDGGDHRIRINLAHDGASLTARIEDDAAAFDPLERDDANPGIHLVKTLVDEVTYSREREQNVFIIRKQTV